MLLKLPSIYHKSIHSLINMETDAALRQVKQGRMLVNVH